MYIPETSSEEIIKMAQSQNSEERRLAARDGGKDVLAMLLNDENWIIRLTVASRGYGLDKLIDDPNENVRARVARSGYGLHKLVNDEHYFVRAAVAEQGYGLEVLLNDTVGDVASCASKYLSEHPDKKITFTNTNVSSAELWRKANSTDYYDRIEAARTGGTDILSKLVFDFNDDHSQFVREAVANRGFGLDILLTDPSVEVRAAVAKQGYGLSTLVNDEHYVVKSAVAEQGYGLDIIINEPMGDTASVARKYISEHSEELCKEIARKEIADITDGTMIGVVSPTEEDKIPSQVIQNYYEMYCTSPQKNTVCFSDYLFEKVESFFEDDKKYYEEYLVGLISERISSSNLGLLDAFQKQLDTKTPLEMLKECGYNHTTVDIESCVDRPYHLNLLFSEKLQNFVEQQGHSLKNILSAAITNNPFVQSLQRNIADMGETASKLTALVSMKGKELLSALNAFAHKTGNIELSSNTAMGLFNEEIGKGSSFSIELEKNAVLPVSELTNVQFEKHGEPADASHKEYTVFDTCDISSDLWEKGQLTITQSEKRKAPTRSGAKKTPNLERD